ncbi:MAG: hypothetical protein SGJ27_21500 [Candidatus Melainabacteria bacterium]|nr:hypothetical protein [Candidatus Melainabacteria bacterium]
MKKLRVFLFGLFLVAAALISASRAFAVDETTWQGYIVDRQCADSVRQDSDPEPFVKHHTKDCALMANCKSRGYSIYSNCKWFDLDKHGDQLAIRLLQASKRTSGFYVEIRGTSKGSVLKVKKIKEIGEPEAKRPESK